MRIKILLTLLFLLIGWLVLKNMKSGVTDNDSVLDVIKVEEAKTQIEFDATKWNIKKGWGYAYRNEMLDDLMNDPKIRELKKDEIIALLGEPNRINGTYLYYLIDQKRAIILPLHTKTLVINLFQDSTINWMKIHE